MRYLRLLAILALLLQGAGVMARTPWRVLVFSRTTGFRHDSIPAGIDCIRALAKTRGFEVDASEDSAVFTPENLKRYRAVVFLNTTGDLFNEAQKAAFKSYMERGGGYVGVHAATDTEHNWPWYKEMVGAEFTRHPAAAKATLRVEDRKDGSTKMLPIAWERFDEWYEFSPNPRPRAHILLTLDESTYSGGGMGKDHPFAWRRNIGSGRVWYTGCGHSSESFSEPLLRAHLLGGIRWAARK